MNTVQISARNAPALKAATEDSCRSHRDSDHKTPARGRTVLPRRRSGGND